MSVKPVLELTEEEREELSGIARGSRGRQVIAGWRVTRGRALLKCDQGLWDPGLAGSSDCRGSGGDGTFAAELAQTSGSGRSRGGSEASNAGPAGAQEGGWASGSGRSIGEETVRQTLKKRMKAMAAGHVVHSEAAKPSFRGWHGADAQGIPAAVRSAASGGVHGRDEQAARGGSPRAVSGTPWVAREVRRHYLRRGACTAWMFGEPLSRLADGARHQTAHDVGLGEAVRTLANLSRSRRPKPVG